MNQYSLNKYGTNLFNLSHPANPFHMYEISRLSLMEPLRSVAEISKNDSSEKLLKIGRVGLVITGIYECMLQATNIMFVNCCYPTFSGTGYQGGRTWQPFVGSKNGNENFRQTRIYNFRVKCVVFARNRKFAKLTQ